MDVRRQRASSGSAGGAAGGGRSASAGAARPLAAAAAGGRRRRRRTGVGRRRQLRLRPAAAAPARPARGGRRGAAAAAAGEAGGRSRPVRTGAPRRPPDRERGAPDGGRRTRAAAPASAACAGRAPRSPDRAAPRRTAAPSFWRSISPVTSAGCVVSPKASARPRRIVPSTASTCAGSGAGSRRGSDSWRNRYASRSGVKSDACTSRTMSTKRRVAAGIARLEGIRVRRGQPQQQVERRDAQLQRAREDDDAVDRGEPGEIEARLGAAPRLQRANQRELLAGDAEGRRAAPRRPRRAGRRSRPAPSDRAAAGTCARPACATSPRASRTAGRTGCPCPRRRSAPTAPAAR